LTATYVDTNVLVYAFGDPSHPKRKVARRTLEGLADEGPIVTCTLTIDEFLWARRRESGQEAAIDDARALLDMPVLQLIAVEPKDAQKAIDQVEKHSLAPRDAFHYAVMQRSGCIRMLSDDPDFDGLPGMDRVTPRPES
jgi:predicted nucleic acid-binding protein